MKTPWYFESQILKLPPCVDQPAAGVWLEQGWRILKLLRCVDYSAPRATRAGLSILHGWGPLLLEPDPEGVFRVPNCAQGAAAFLTLVWWIQGMMPIPLSAVGVARTTMWGPVQTGWSGSFSQSLPTPHLLADRDEPNCPKEWVSFLSFLGRYGGKLFSGPGGVGTSSGQLLVRGFPWVSLSLGVFSQIKSQGENSLRTLGALGLE